MIFIKRLFATLVFLVALVVLLLSLAGAVGIWIVKPPVTASASRVFTRVDNALGIADDGLVQVQATLAQASQRLVEAHQQQQKLSQQPQNNVLGRVLAQTVQQTIAPGVTDANQQLYTVAEAAVVVNSVLADLGEFPFLSVTGLDTERLADMNRRLADVPPAAWELSRLLGETPNEADAQFSRIEQALEHLRGLLADYAGQVAQIRQRTETLRVQVFTWLTPAVIGISAFCGWIALSQLSLLVHACSWWRAAGRA